MSEKHKPHTPIFLLSRDMLCYDDMYDDTYDVCTASIDDSPLSDSNGYSSRYILLDTGAGQSVFKDENLFYSLSKSDSLLIDGVNSHSAPFVITEYGRTDFGTVYYSRDVFIYPPPV